MSHWPGYLYTTPAYYRAHFPIGGDTCPNQGVTAMNLRQFEARRAKLQQRDDDRITPRRFLGGLAFCLGLIALFWLGAAAGL